MPVRRRGFSEYEDIWTKKDADNALFFPMVGPLEAASIASVRPAFEITNLSGTVDVKPAYQLSDDGETWDNSSTFTEIPDVVARTSEGITYHADFETLTLSKKFVRFGLRIKNASMGTTLENCKGALRLEFKRC